MPPALRAVLERAQLAGMLGPGDVAKQADHALGFLSHLRLPPTARCVDLGSGAGVPGLPLALAHSDSSWVLLDAWQARCELLERAVRELSLKDRVSVVHGRAEEIAHGPLRGRFDIVVARSFGAPPVTAECAAPLLQIGGALAVSVAAEAAEWPDVIEELGLVADASWQVPEGAFRSFRRTGPVAPRFPRRPAAQRRSPLF